MIVAGPKAHPRTAFTLVELLLVTGIITSLVGILLPSVAAVRQRARLVRCQANVRTIVTAVSAYATENAGQYPPNTAFPAPGVYWYEPRAAGRELAAAGAALACPDDADAARSYAQNAWSCRAGDSRVIQMADRNIGTGWSLGERGSERLILVAESWSYQGSLRTGFGAPASIGFAGLSAGQRFGGDGGLTPFWAGRHGWVNCELPYARHRGRAGGRGTEPVGRVNLGYADGHVALRSNTDLVDPTTGRSTGDSAWNPTERP